MPTYLIKNTETEEEKEVFMNYGTLQEYLSMNPSWSQIHKSSHIVGGVRDVFSRTDEGWKDVVKSIKKGSGKCNTVRY